MLMILCCGALAVVSAQESGAQPSSARSWWSRLLGSRQYEYDERVDLSLDGSARVDVNASLAALVALRGGDFNLDPEARFDRAAARAFFQAPGVTIRDLSAFRRHGRRFVHVRFDIADIRNVSGVRALAWSRYALARSDNDYRFVQDVGPPVGHSAPDVGWTGDELVAFRLHLPSKINFHNSPNSIERGNILAWEQPLRDRLAGRPLHLEVRMDTQSILYRTLWLFAGTFIAALLVLAAIVWWVSRKGKRQMVPA
jgi:hypothetical protein